MCQNRTDSQKPLSGAWANVQGHATAQLQLSNQSPVMCQLGISVMSVLPFAHHDNMTPTPVVPLAAYVGSGSFATDRGTTGGRGMSASLRKRTCVSLPRYVRFVPKADICSATNNAIRLSRR